MIWVGWWRVSVKSRGEVQVWGSVCVETSEGGILQPHVAAWSLQPWEIMVSMTALGKTGEKHRPLGKPNSDPEAKGLVGWNTSCVLILLQDRLSYMEA